MTLIDNKILAIIEEIEPVAKLGENAAQKYSYRRYEDVLEAVRGLLIKHKVIDQIMHEVQSIEAKKSPDGSVGSFLTTLDSVFTLIAVEDGSEREYRFVGQGWDQGDKGANKAMTAAMKYFYGQAFKIRFVGEDSEQDETVPPSPIQHHPVVERPVSSQSSRVNAVFNNSAVKDKREFPKFVKCDCGKTAWPTKTSAPGNYWCNNYGDKGGCGKNIDLNDKRPSRDFYEDLERAVIASTLAGKFNEKNSTEDYALALEAAVKSNAGLKPPVPLGSPIMQIFRALFNGNDEPELLVSILAENVDSWGTRPINEVVAELIASTPGSGNVGPQFNSFIVEQVATRA